jgi:hypothetical protein
MNSFIKTRLRSASFILLVLSILFAIFIYLNTSGFIPGHWDYRGNLDGYTNKSTIVILPLLALFIFITFSFIFRYPQLTKKQSNYGNDNLIEKESGTFLRVLELMSLSAINCILLITYQPQMSILVPLIIGAFIFYNIIFIIRALKKN